MRTLTLFLLLLISTVACAQTVHTVTSTGPGGGATFPITVNPIPAVISTVTPNTFIPGTTTLVTITGTNLLGITGFTVSGTGITMTIQPGATATNMQVSVVLTLQAAMGSCVPVKGLCPSPMGPVKIDFASLIKPIGPPVVSSSLADIKPAN